MRTRGGGDDPRVADVDVAVRLDRAVGCIRCGTETSGTATCSACLQALDELRGLASDPRSPRDAGLWLSERVADLR